MSSGGPGGAAPPRTAPGRSLRSPVRPRAGEWGSREDPGWTPRLEPHFMQRPSARNQRVGSRAAEASSSSLGELLLRRTKLSVVRVVEIPPAPPASLVCVYFHRRRSDTNSSVSEGGSPRCCGLAAALRGFRFASASPRRLKCKSWARPQIARGPLSPGWALPLVVLTPAGC